MMARAKQIISYILKTETSSPITEIILSTSSFLITWKLNIIAYGTLIFTYLIDSLTS